MRYYLKKSTNKTTGSAGKYVAKVSHDNIVDLDTFADTISYSNSLTRSDVVGALDAFSHEITKRLRQGDIVKLPGLGTLKLEMQCKPVDNPEDFNPRQHIVRYQIHVIPESKNGHQAMYENIELTKVK